MRSCIFFYQHFLLPAVPIYVNPAGAINYVYLRHTVMKGTGLLFAADNSKLEVIVCAVANHLLRAIFSLRNCGDAKSIPVSNIVRFPAKPLLVTMPGSLGT